MLLDRSAGLDQLCRIAQGWYGGSDIEFITFAQVVLQAGDLGDPFSIPEPQDLYVRVTTMPGGKVIRVPVIEHVGQNEILRA